MRPVNRLLALLFVAVLGNVARAGDAPPPAKPPTTAAKSAGKPIPGGLEFRDLEYGKAGDVSLRLDLYVPSPGGKPPEKPTPIVVWVHGGGWVGGSKSPC